MCRHRPVVQQDMVAVFPTWALNAYGVMQVRLLMLLLNSAQWRLFPLSVQVLFSGNAGLLVGVPDPPPHVSVSIASLEVPLHSPHCSCAALRC